MRLLSSTWIQPSHISFWLNFQTDTRVSLILHADMKKRLPDISPAKMSLLRWEELQFAIGNHVKPLASPCIAREVEYFYRGVYEVGRAIANRESLAFSLADSLTEKKRTLSSSCWTFYHCRAWEIPLLFFWLYLTEVFVY